MDLNEISDRLEIDDVLTRYAIALDTRNWELFCDCFTSDPRLVYNKERGAETPTKWVQGAKALYEAMFTATQHNITNHLIKLHGHGRASSRSYAIAQHMLTEFGGGGNELLGVYYDDQLVKTDEGWRISERVYNSMWAVGTNPDFHRKAMDIRFKGRDEVHLKARARTSERRRMSGLWELPNVSVLSVSDFEVNEEP